MAGGNRGNQTARVDGAFLLLGIAIAISIAWGIGWLHAREKYMRENAAPAYAAAAKDDAKRYCVGTDPNAVFECVNEKVKAAYQTAHDEQDLSAQQRAASSSLASVIVSFLALLISVVGVWYVKRTLDATLKAVEDAGEATNAMRDANEIARLNARRGLRPYLWPEAAWFRTAEDGTITAHVHIKNYGQTPAINARSWIHTWIAPFPLVDALPEPGIGDVEMGNGIIGPGAHTEFAQNRRPVSPPTNQYLREERIALYVYGYGSYLDMFGKEHFYRYIYFSHGEAFAQGRFAPYTSGNIIDVE